MKGLRVQMESFKINGRDLDVFIKIKAVRSIIEVVSGSCSVELALWNWTLARADVEGLEGRTSSPTVTIWCGSKLLM